MKDIKDYLHLYLGQQCEVVEHFKPHNYAGGLEHHAGTKLHIDAILLAIVHQSNLKVKPILRPLSDMTEAEYQTLSVEHYGRPWELTESKEDFFKKGDRNFSDADLYNDCAIGMVYLLSRGFDLFGLIESGLAIDKTAVPAP